MLTRLIAGAGTRKTRLHDEQGNLTPSSRLVRNAPRAFASGVARLAAGYRPRQPWISYDAQKLLAAHLTSRSRVLEYGSGMSTIWYARRAGEVVSIEDYRPWFDKVKAILADAKADNVSYRFAADQREYISLTDKERGSGFDLIMIDGSVRDQCLAESVELLRPEGILYLDNSDKGVDVTTGDIPGARQTLVELANRWRVQPVVFTDFAPTQLFAQQGFMVRRPG